MPKLSIAVITMNRAEQLKEALASCLACELPEGTEFVIIDNASTDHTADAVKETMQSCGYPYYYEKLPENLGVGGGRNYAYDKATGDYTYVLDDDAVIDVEGNPDFFTRTVSIMDGHPEIATLTTQIYDTAWERDRVTPTGKEFAAGLYRQFMFCGGSHFLRRSFFATAPYLSNKYGYEEIPPSLRAMNAKMINAYAPDLRIIHKPAVNKWDWAEDKNRALLVKGHAIPYAIKKMMYPRIAAPLLRLAQARRHKIYLREFPGIKAEIKQAVKDFMREYPIKEKIKLSTLLRMLKDFKLSTF